MRFKIMLSLICSPEFIKAHLSKSSTKNDYTHHGLVLTIFEPDINIKQCSLAHVLNSDTTKAIEIDYPLNYVYGEVMVVGSCNGLFCISIG